MKLNQELISAINSGRIPLKVKYLSGHSEDDQVLSRLVSWKVVRAIQNEIDIQLTFSDPLLVSGGTELCELSIGFGSGQAFKSFENDEALKADTKIQSRIVRQHSNDSLTAALTSFS